MTHDPIEDLKRYAAALEAQVSGERSRAAARAALRSPTPPRSPRRTVVAVATVVLMGVSNVALAAASNPAVPGDALYGIDLAYERVGSLVGLSGNNVDERASEFRVLQERGESAEALRLVQDTLTKLLEADDPAAAVAEFTEALGGADISEALEKLLVVARSTKTTGSEVSAIARTIVDSIELPDKAQGNPGGPAEPGPPADRGPGEPGPPADRGPANPPENPGRGTPGG